MSYPGPKRRLQKQESQQVGSVAKDVKLDSPRVKKSSFSRDWTSKAVTDSVVIDLVLKFPQKSRMVSRSTFSPVSSQQSCSRRVFKRKEDLQQTGSSRESCEQSYFRPLVSIQGQASPDDIWETTVYCCRGFHYYLR